jgi:site-specific DNA-methyltransferase (adenine-specific)
MKLYKGDCLIQSDKIESGSVDLILTDLPYGTVKGIKNVNHGMSGKCEWDEVIDTNEIYKVANRILRKNGKMVLFAQQPFTTELINKAIANIPFNYSMIWEKDHFANALTAKKAPLNYYEDVLVFSKNNETELIHPLRYYAKQVFDFCNVSKKEIINSFDMVKVNFLRFEDTQFACCPFKTYQKFIAIYGIDKMQGFKEFTELKEIDSEFKKKFASTFNLWEGKKYKSNILKYKKDYDGHHPTQKPVLLLEDLIKTFSNENDLVVDLTMGSGSTGVACKNTNRDFIGIEMNEEYFKIAEQRINGTLF